MFFVLSKILSYLARPLVMVCLLLLASLFTRGAKWKKRLVIFAIGLLFFFSNEFIANEIMRAWEVPVTAFEDVKKTYSFGIVLTGVTMSSRKPHDRVYFQKGADRVMHTFQLYKLGKIKKILISGGSGRLTKVDVLEADQLQEAFLLMGVAKEDIIVENQSRNTYESALLAKKILPTEGDPEMLLITSGFHMRRSRACFEKAGVNVDTFSADFHSHPREFTLDVLLIPKVEAILLWQILIKEWVGMLAYKIAGYI